MSMDGVLHQMPAFAGRVAARRGEATSETISDETRCTRHVTGSAGQALLVQALARENMQRAWKRVKANKGAAGVDGMDIAQTGRYLTTALPTIREQLMAGTYRPSPVRRVGIPKPDGSMLSACGTVFPCKGTFPPFRATGQLSPLLANVLLDEVDRELERRGHRFVRYADDCNVYVRNQKAGQRVMALLKRLYDKLRLKINESKSAVASAFGRKFLGYSLWAAPKGEVKRSVSGKAKDTFKQ